MSEFLRSNISVVTNVYLILQIQKAANNAPILLLRLCFFLSIFSKDLFVFICMLTFQLSSQRKPEHVQLNRSGGLGFLSLINCGLEEPGKERWRHSSIVSLALFQEGMRGKAGRRGICLDMWQPLQVQAIPRHRDLGPNRLPI